MPQSSRRVCILVVGMHRSGTSAFARVLSLLGCDLPKTLMGSNKSNEAGHWESIPICRLNDRILESAGCSWHDWLQVNPNWLQSLKAEEFRQEALALLRKEFGSSRLFVLKDPRICRLIPFWLEVLEEAGARPLIVSPVRNPLEVAASLGKRNGFQAALGHLLWLRHVLEGEFASRGTPRFFTSYDRLMCGWARAATEAQAALGIAWPRMSDKVTREIDGFLSLNYRHHQQPTEAVLENSTLSDWLRSTFEILDRWSAAGEDPQDFATLDRIRAELNTAAPAFSRLFDAQQEKAARLEKELGTERQRVGDIARELAATREDLQRTTAARAEAEAIASGLKEHVVLLIADAKERQPALAMNNAAIAGVAKQVKHLLAVLDTSRHELATKLSDSEQARQQQADEIAALRNLVEEKQRETERLRLIATGEISRAAGLLIGQSSRFSWKPFRLRRQIALLRGTGMVDAEWYLASNTDVAEAKMDPIRHYIEFGAREGRLPNPALAETNGHAADKDIEVPYAQPVHTPQSTGNGRS